MVWCVNQGARSLASNPMFHGRTKHIELDVHFIKEQVATKNLSVLFVTSEFQVVDLLIKALSENRFCILRNKLSLVAYKQLSEKERLKIEQRK